VSIIPSGDAGALAVMDWIAKWSDSLADFRCAGCPLYQLQLVVGDVKGLKRCSMAHWMVLGRTKM